VKQAKREWWAHVRTRGAFHYIVVYWVLGWGLVTGIAWGVLMALLGYGAWLDMIYTGIILFTLLGWPAGFAAWRFYEARFQRGPGT
jgi:hypothetical protein